MMKETVLEKIPQISEGAVVSPFLSFEFHLVFPSVGPDSSNLERTAQ